MSNDVDDLGRRENYDRLLLGGSWIFRGVRCRSADRNRIWLHPRSKYFGFRLALRCGGRSPIPTREKNVRNATRAPAGRNVEDNE